MRKKVTSLLRCPNNGSTDFKIFGLKVFRNGNIFNKLSDEEILLEDEIEEGLLLCKSSNTIFPISESIAILLADADVDLVHHKELLTKYIDNCPEEFNNSVIGTMERLGQQSETEHGVWNRDEMRYYDKEVETAQQRSNMEDNIKNVPVWRIFLPRKKYIINQIKDNVQNKVILEIGSGNSRTVFNIFNPDFFSYSYTGTDISFKRLVVAKSILPQGEFIQCSALNLPFRNNSFDAIISFGMLHHLPDPEIALNNCSTLLKQNGILAFHEPIIRPAIRLPWINTYKNAVATYEHSTHDGKIELKSTLEHLKKMQFVKIKLNLKNSTVRAFTESIYNKIKNKKLPGKKTVLALEYFDELILSTVSKVIKSMGPGTVYGVFKKNE